MQALKSSRPLFRAAVLLLGLFSLAPMIASAAAPAAPTGLWFKQYGDREVEIFWKRPASNYPSGGFEIRQNGAVVGTVPGTSFFTNSAPASGALSYTVTAVGAGGQRSAPTSLTVRGGGSTAAADGGGNTATGGTAPKDLRIATYSGQLAEMFWTPPASNGKLISRYELFLNGNLLMHRVGTSQLLQNLNAGARYQYGVRAMYTDGTRSDMAYVSYTAGSPGTTHASAAGGSSSEELQQAANSQVCD